MTSWEETEAIVKAHGEQSGQWLKLNDGESAVVVFIGDTYPRSVAFVDGRYVQHTPELAAKGVKSLLRIAYNVALVDSREVKVFEQSEAFFRELVIVRKKYGFDKWAFEIQRHGSGLDTKYKILADRPLTDDEQRIFKELPLLDLKKVYTEQGTNEKKGASGRTTEAPGIDAKAEIVQALKALPPTAVSRFLSQFSVQKVRDLPVEKLSDAKAFVAQLTREAREPAPAPQAEVDPFA